MYGDYFQGLLRGDFGQTFTRESVIEAISRFSVASVGLLAIALTLSVTFGILLGRLAVRRSRNGIAPWLTFLSTIGLALPSFYVAILLIAIFLLYFYAQHPLPGLRLGRASDPARPCAGHPAHGQDRARHRRPALRRVGEAIRHF
jgi:ABC-type dipeptide/oligopeptide/nickel transport system permease component